MVIVMVSSITVVSGKVEQNIIVSIDCMDWIPSIPVPAQFGVN